MDKEALLARFREMGCTPTCDKDAYSSLLIRCGCGRHAMAAAACGEKTDEPVKLFGAALSWYLATNKTGVLTYVVGADPAGRWTRAVEALQSLEIRNMAVNFLVDFEDAPAGFTGDLHTPAWVDEMLRRGELQLPAGARALEDGPHAFRWYRSVTGSEWSGRLDGLQICTLGSTGSELLFSVGSPAEPRGAGVQGDGGARAAFLRIIRANARQLGLAENAENITVHLGDTSRAQAVIQLLASHRLPEHGSAEHRLEAQVLRGAVTLRVPDGPLVPVAERYPFQFPTRWWRDGSPRYLDVMARQGSTPWLVELKVDGSRGEYYRNGIVQVALYRAYVRRSGGLDRWFSFHGLERKECRAALVVAPFGPDDELLRQDHKRVAEELGIALIEEPAAAA